MLENTLAPILRMGTLVAHRWQGRLYAAADTPIDTIDTAGRACRASLVPFALEPAGGFALLYPSNDLAVFWWEAATLGFAACRLQGEYPPKRRHEPASIPLLEAELIGHEATWWRRTGPGALVAYLFAPAWTQPL